MRNDQEVRLLLKFLDGVRGRWVFLSLIKGTLPDASLPGMRFHAEDVGAYIDPSGNDLPYFLVKHDLPNDLFKGLNRKTKIPLQISQTVVNRFRPHMLPRSQFKTLCDRYGQELVLRVTEVYGAVCGGSNMLSVPPRVIRGFDIEHFELFGSPFNACGPYCSAFALDRQMGSSGPYQHWNPPTDRSLFIIVNPPFDLTIMEDAVCRVLNWAATHPNLIFLVVLPDWPSGDDFKARQMIEQAAENNTAVSIKSDILDKRQYKFYDYGRDEYISVVNSMIAVVKSSTVPIPLCAPVTLEKIKAVWMTRT